MARFDCGNMDIDQGVGIIRMFIHCPDDYEQKSYKFLLIDSRKNER